jgi:hypothetical protein
MTSTSQISSHRWKRLELSLVVPRWSNKGVLITLLPGRKDFLYPLIREVTFSAPIKHSSPLLNVTSQNRTFLGFLTFSTGAQLGIVFIIVSPSPSPFPLLFPLWCDWSLN